MLVLQEQMTIWKSILILDQQRLELFLHLQIWTPIMRLLTTLIVLMANELKMFLMQILMMVLEEDFGFKMKMVSIYLGYVMTLLIMVIPLL